MLGSGKSSQVSCTNKTSMLRSFMHLYHALFLCISLRERAFRVATESSCKYLFA